MGDTLPAISPYAVAGCAAAVDALALLKSELEADDITKRLVCLAPLKSPASSIELGPILCLPRAQATHVRMATCRANAHELSPLPMLQETMSKLTFVAKALGNAKVKSDLLPFFMDFIVREILLSHNRRCHRC